MTEVLKALQELNVCWKKIGQYNMKCRWIPGTPGHHEGMVNHPAHYNHFFGDEPTIIENDGIINSPNVVKFEVQVMLTILIASLVIALRPSLKEFIQESL
jgi:5'-AMP-activated protein kinase catalytic alpha subunit